MTIPDDEESIIHVSMWDWSTRIMFSFGTFYFIISEFSDSLSSL